MVIYLPIVLVLCAMSTGLSLLMIYLARHHFQLICRWYYPYMVIHLIRTTLLLMAMVIFAWGFFINHIVQYL